MNGTRVKLRFTQPSGVMQGAVEIVLRNRTINGVHYAFFCQPDLTGLTATVIGIIEPPAARRFADTPQVLLLCDELLRAVDGRETYALTVWPDDIAPLDETT